VTSWILLILAGLLEIVWAVGMKLSAGFTRVGWSAVTLVALVLSMGLLALATRNLPIGTAYAAWVGIGAAGTAIAGMVFLGLLIVSLVGLKFATPSA
jgi:quaternary ammonium compound-resistance protein SugE